MINSLLDVQYSKKVTSHYLSINCMTDIQCYKIKSSIMDMNNYLNEVYLSFNRLYKELSPSFCLIDNFPNCFFSHTVNYKDKDVFNNQMHSLNKLINDSSSNTENILVIANAGIKMTPLL